MYMPYTKNPNMPKVRAKAVNMLQKGHSMREVARYFGVSPGTVCKWNKKAPIGGCYEIPTESSRPKSHPKAIPKDIVEKIVQLRIKTKGRCAEVIHQHLLNEGIKVSLNSVKRTLKRNGLIKKRSPWKRYHKPIERPKAFNNGDLVQVDTIHIINSRKERIYVYTLLDVYSRWVYAKAFERSNTWNSILFFKTAQKKAPFKFKCLQSDHGSEFSQHFSKRIKITHRHSRVRKPNDNAHIERFNRTIQNELLRYLPKDVKIINRQLPKYLNYYNSERLHLGLGLKTPLQVASKCFQAIG